VLKQLEAFGHCYAQMLTDAIHRVKESKGIDSVQLFQIAVIKFVLTTVFAETDKLLYKLRKASIKESQRKLELSERITWINRNKNNLSYQVTYEIFSQLLWIEKGTVNKIRDSLLGMAWTIPEDLLSNPLLKTPDKRDHEILMTHYVLLSKYPDSYYGFERLSLLIDTLLDKVAKSCQIQIASCADNQVIDENRAANIRFSWKDVPANMAQLFDLENTQLALAEESTNALLKATLQYQQKANEILEQGLREAQVIKHLLAAYETPLMYNNYFKLIKPYLLYQTLCNEADDFEVELKLQNQLKIRPLCRSEKKP